MTEVLTAEEINYILSFMDKSTDYCENDEDYRFDENVKKTLLAMIESGKRK